MHLVPFRYPISLPVFFFTLLAFLFIIKSLTCIWTQNSFLPWAPLPRRDRMQLANMGPAGKFLDIRQGDRSIEDYAGDFVGMARQSATEKSCLMSSSGEAWPTPLSP